MINPKLIEDFSARFSELLAASPAKDIERNAKALAASVFARLDLVTREEFDIQRELLARSREKLEALEARVQELERSLGSRPS